MSFGYFLFTSKIYDYCFVTLLITITLRMISYQVNAGPLEVHVILLFSEFRKTCIWIKNGLLDGWTDKRVI